jgi:hypothetical protein
LSDYSAKAAMMLADRVRELEGENARLRRTLVDCRITIANPNPGICCTIWYDDITTLLDLINLTLGLPSDKTDAPAASE